MSLGSRELHSPNRQRRTRSISLLLLRPERVLFRSRFDQRGIVLSHFCVVGEVALHVAVQQIALFQAQCLAPCSEPLQLRCVNGPPLINGWRYDRFGSFLETVMIGRSRGHFLM